MDTTETYYPKKAMTLTLESDCLEQLINDYNRKELTKDDVVMLISYITYNNIYTKCKEYLENAINEIGNNSSYVKALIKLHDKTEKEINKIYLNNKDNLLYKYQLIIENDLLDYQYFN